MTILSGALGALSTTSRKAEPNRSPHAIFVESQLLPAVGKVQKEIGWRRYKVRSCGIVCIRYVLYICTLYLCALVVVVAAAKRGSVFETAKRSLLV